jgi:hypothetical protein
MKLVLPFVWVAASILVFPFEGQHLLFLVAAALAGLILRRKIGRINLVTLLGAGMIAGAVTAVAAIPWSGPTAPASGAIVGMFLATPLAPLVGAVEWVRARPRSLLDGVSWRCGLIAAALTGIVLIDWGRLLEARMPYATALLIANGVAIAICVEIDTWRLWRLKDWHGDLGVGDAAPLFVNEGSPYRSEPRVISIVRGDLDETRRILRRQLTFDVAALLFALAGITAGLTT